MFTPKQYRDKADQYSDLAKMATSNDEREEFRQRQRSFSVMADNEQWLSDNHHRTVHAEPDQRGSDDNLATEEEHMLRCLGAAVLMQWNTLPRKLRRDLFDDAGSMGALRDVAAVRAQLARFLHKHKDDQAIAESTTATCADHK